MAWTEFERSPKKPSSAVNPTLVSITYQSRANGDFTWAQLDDLTRAAQGRNRAAGITGVLLYEDGRFFQTIEGPVEALEPVWQSIRSDPRHRYIDILAMNTSRLRMYSGWDMRWMRKGRESGRGLDFLEPRNQPKQYARLALQSSSDALVAELEARLQAIDLATFVDYVVEPTARVLGDWWMQDDIDQVALAAALSNLHHLVHVHAARQPLVPSNGRKILCATLPNETHLLG